MYMRLKPLYCLLQTSKQMHPRSLSTPYVRQCQQPEQGQHLGYPSLNHEYEEQVVKLVNFLWISGMTSKSMHFYFNEYAQNCCFLMYKHPELFFCEEW